MIPKSLVERLVEIDVYIYIKHIEREFGGILDSITDENIVILKDKYNNLIYIPLEIIDVITERR
ncbi:MAG: hypothetical protein ACFFFB_00015 [Candidatus Heimdallarchaeota archaeon]